MKRDFAIKIHTLLAENETVDAEIATSESHRDWCEASDRKIAIWNEIVATLEGKR